MRAVRNAKKIALKSYSMWANYLGAVALILPEVIYYKWQIDTNPRLWWYIGVGLILFGVVGRLVAQNIDSPTDRRFRAPGAVTVAAMMIAMAQIPPPVPEPQPAPPAATSYTQDEFLEIAVPHIAKWEGLRTEAYQDIVGVWTVCYGETRGVQPGDSYTKAECRDMLAAMVVEYQQGWHEYLTPETLTERLNPHRDAGFTSLAVNVGKAGAGKSTATRRLNAGNIPGACEAIGWWNKAGNRVVRGLVLRRKDDIALCMTGVA